MRRPAATVLRDLGFILNEASCTTRHERNGRVSLLFRTVRLETSLRGGTPGAIPVSLGLR